MEPFALIGPVTALEFTENYLLAGIGPWLHVYDLNTKKPLLKNKCLPGGRIHGTRKCPSHEHENFICVFGQKTLLVSSFETSGGKIRMKSVHGPVHFPDWIWDMTWLTDGSATDSSLLALALGHNSVQLYNWKTNSLLEKVQCEEICILYCASLIGNSWENLVLAAGTVFNQVVIWGASGQRTPEGHAKVLHRISGHQVVIWGVSGQRTPEGHAKVLHRLFGHQGVIFSIAYHPDHNHLCSVSDDRSLQLWMLTPDTCRTQDCHNLTLEDWQTMQFNKLYQLYGHSARIWDVKLLDEVFITVGEDSSICVWNYSGQIVQKFKGHRGKSIWSLAVHGSQSVIATGGGDCSIRLWDLKNTDQVGKLTSATLVIQMLEEPDYPRAVSLLNQQTILVLTNEGAVFQYTMESGEWKRILVDKNFKSYGVLAPSPCEKYIALGNICGTVKIINLADRMTSDHQLLEGKIHNILWLSEGDSGDCVLVSGPNGSIYPTPLPGKHTAELLIQHWATQPHIPCQVPLLHMGEVRQLTQRDLPKVSRQRQVLYEVLSHTGKTSMEKVHCQFTLPYCKQRWVTCGTLLEEEGLLVCGDRGGTVHVYNLSGTRVEPVQSFLKAHGKSGVSHVCYHEGHVYSTGRDGQYIQYSVENGELKLLNGNKVAKGFEWLCRLLFHNGETYALGFHTVNFEMWNLNTNQKLLEIECGGGHRDWDFSFLENQAVFVYIKRGEVVLHQGKLKSNQSILQPPLHGRELTDVKHIMSCEDTHILATCSEDTDVNILALSYDSEGCQILTPLKRLQGHISSIRCLALSSPLSSQDNTSFLLFSAGGRAQMRCWRIHFRISDSEKVVRPSGSDSVRGHSNECVSRSHEPSDNQDDKSSGYNILEVDETHGSSEEKNSDSVQGNSNECVSRSHQPCDYKDDKSSGCNILDVGETHGSSEEKNSDSVQRNCSECVSRSHQPGDSKDDKSCDIVEIGETHGSSGEESSKQSKLCCNSEVCEHNCVLNQSELSSPCEQALFNVKIGENRNRTELSHHTYKSVEERTALCDETGGDEIKLPGNAICCAINQKDYKSRTGLGDEIGGGDIKLPGNLTCCAINQKDFITHEGSNNSGQCGARFVWNSITCSHELLCNYMLHHKGRKSRKPWKKFEYNPSLETRFMALTTFSACEVGSSCGDGLHFVGAACSDGVLRLFKFSEVSKSFQLLSETSFHDHCLLCVSHLVVRDSSRASVLLLSAGTDGRIAVWDITKTVMLAGEEEESYGAKLHGAQNKEDDSRRDFGEPVFVIKAHQSGVNAVAVKMTSDKNVLVVSGGDDNALVLTHLLIQPSPDGINITQLQHVIQPSAHAAQITGLQFIGDYLITASIDQRIARWEWSLENETLAPTDVKFIDVADVSASDYWRSGEKDFTVVCGTGLQLLGQPVQNPETS